MNIEIRFITGSQRCGHDLLSIYLSTKSKQVYTCLIAPGIVGWLLYPFFLIWKNIHKICYSYRSNNIVLNEYLFVNMEENLFIVQC